MSNFKKLRIAAKDGHCGSVHYCEDDSYVRSRNIETVFELGDLQLVQLTMQTYFELKKDYGAVNSVVECFAADCSRAVNIAKALYDDRTLDTYAGNNTDFGEIFDSIIMLISHQTIV